MTKKTYLDLESQETETEIKNNEPDLMRIIQRAVMFSIGCIALITFVVFNINDSVQQPIDTITNNHQRSMLSDGKDQEMKEFFRKYMQQMNEKLGPFNGEFNFLKQSDESSYESDDFSEYGVKQFEEDYDQFHGKDYNIISIGSSSTQAFQKPSGDTKAKEVPIEHGIGALIQYDDDDSRIDAFLTEIKQTLNVENVDTVLQNAIGYGAAAIVKAIHGTDEGKPNLDPLLEIGTNVEFSDAVIDTVKAAGGAGKTLMQLHQKAKRMGLKLFVQCRESSRGEQTMTKKQIQASWAHSMVMKGEKPAVIDVGGGTTVKLYTKTEEGQKGISAEATSKANDLYKPIQAKLKAGESIDGSDLEGFVTEMMGRMQNILVTAQKHATADEKFIVYQTGKMREDFYKTPVNSP